MTDQVTPQLPRGRRRLGLAGASKERAPTFRTRSLSAGVALLDAIGRLADAANHHPDVDLRYAGVTVRLVSHDIDGLSERDVELARQISAVAHELDVDADPTAVQTVQVSIDALAPRSGRSSARCSGTGRRGLKTWSTPTDAGRRCGSSGWTRRARSAIASTSTSPCQAMRPRPAWPPGWAATERGAHRPSLRRSSKDLPDPSR